MALGEILRVARENIGVTPSQVAAATRMKVQMVEDLEREDFSRIAAPIYGKGFIRLYAEYLAIEAGPLVEEYVTRFVESKMPSLKSESGSSAPTPVPAMKQTAPPEPEPPPATEPPIENLPPDPVQSQDTTVREADEPTEQLPPDDLFAMADREATLPDGSPSWNAEDTPLFAGIEPADPDQGPTPEEPMAPAATGAEEEDQQETEPQSWQEWVEGVKNIRFSESPVTMISVGLVVVVLLIFVASSLSRYGCRADRDDVPLTTEEIEQELRLAIDPPEPYVD